jgi:hypothetical protein
MAMKHLLVTEHSDYEYQTDKRALVVDFANGFV